MTKQWKIKIALCVILISLVSCAGAPIVDYYSDPDMDFGAVKTAAVMPFENLTREQQAADRVRDAFTNALLADGQMYVMPPGEVARGALTAGVTNASAPSKEEVIKLAAVIKVDVVITGSVREYGEVRSGNTTANIISMSLRMFEAQTGKIIWSSATTKGGITMKDRLLGGGGRPMNDVTEEAVQDLIRKLPR